MTPRFSVRTSRRSSASRGVSPASIPNSRGRYAEAIGILKRDPHNVGRRSTTS